MDLTCAAPVIEIEIEELAEVSAGFFTAAARFARYVLPGGARLGRLIKGGAALNTPAMMYDFYDGYQGASKAGAGTAQSIGEAGVNAASQGAYNYLRDR